MKTREEKVRRGQRIAKQRSGRSSASRQSAVIHVLDIEMPAERSDLFLSPV